MIPHIKRPPVVGRDENIRYDISDIGDVRHDIGDNRYIVEI